MDEPVDKVTYFQAISGIDDTDLCTEILAAHGWDLELAVSSITASSSPMPPPAPPPTTTATAPTARAFTSPSNSSQPQSPAEPPEGSGLAWKLITLPFYVVSGGVGLIAGTIRFGVWVAGGILSRSFSILSAVTGVGGVQAGRLNGGNGELSPSTAEASEFVASFDRDYPGGPRFARVGFADALRRAQREYRPMFVYLHSPDHPDVPAFCSGSLCSMQVSTFINENFVAWGGSVRKAEGFKMGNSLGASRFPFCAVVMGSNNQQIALLQQIEGPKSPEEMVAILQRVADECSPGLVAARIENEERANNQRLREEQDAAYRAALEADQARERQRREEEERLAREAAESDRKRREEEEAKERAALEAAEKVAAAARRRQEKAMSLRAEPEKAADVTQVLVRFPTGERKERRFHSSCTISALYDYVDSLDCLNAEKYSLVSNFPRVVYGPDKHSLTLKEAGLHPQASLFVEVEQ